MYDSLLPSHLPDQGMSDTEIKKKYGGDGKKPFKTFYGQSAMYYARYYNKMGVNNLNKTQAGYVGEVQEIIENFEFMHGKQQSSEFYFMQQGIDDVGNIVDSNIPYMPGKETSSIMKFLNGQFLGITNNVKPHARVMNPEIKSKVTNKLKSIEIARKFKKQLDEIKELSGYELDTPIDPNANQDEIIKAVYQSVSTDLQVDATRMLNYIKSKSLGMSDMSRGFINCVVGRRVVTHDNGDGTFKLVAPYKYFSVSSEDDDRGKYDIARGAVEQISRLDALKKYQSTLDREDFESIKNKTFVETGMLTAILPYYAYSLYDEDTDFISEVTVYWKSTIDSRIKVVTNADGEKVALKLRNNSRKKGNYIQVIRYATILAGCITADYGVYDVISDDNIEGNRLFPFMHFAPNVYLGYNQSIVDDIKGLQREMDAIDYRIRENFTLDLGTIYVLNGKKFKDGVSPTELYMQLRRHRIHVTTTSGIEGDPTDREPTIYREDVSLMKEIQNYINLHNSKNAKINEIANVSSIVRGIQTQYVGSKTQQSSVAQANNSVQYNIAGTIQLFSDSLALALENLKRTIQKDPDNPKWQNLLGEDGVQRILDLKDDPYTLFHVVIEMNETIDAARKDRMMMNLERLMATGQVDFEDYINIEDATSIKELKDYAKYAVNKKRYQQEQAAYVDAMTKQNTAETIADANMAGREMENATRMESEKLQAGTGIAKEVIKQGGSPDEAAATVQGMFAE